MLAEILCWARGKKFYLTDGLLHNIKRATESSADVQLLWVVQHLDANLGSSASQGSVLYLCLRGWCYYKRPGAAMI